MKANNSGNKAILKLLSRLFFFLFFFVFSRFSSTLTTGKGRGGGERRTSAPRNCPTTFGPDCSIFDPLGFLAPLTVRGKMLMQEAWLEDVTWDDFLLRQLIKK